MNNKEKIIKEKRLIEAAEKNLMGASGKLGSICRYLGTEINAMGGSFHDTYEYSFEDWGEEDTDELPTSSLDESVYIVGYLFDGLSRGYHLEIKYISTEKKLTCNYKGYEVYKEISGDLKGYAPFPEWENIIEKLYKITAKQARIKKQESAKMERESKLAAAFDYLKNVRRKWGL